MIKNKKPKKIEDQNPKIAKDKTKTVGTLNF